MDYGVMKLGEGLKVHLYGTPGQERFSFMWDIITIGGLGMVILVDNDGDDPLADLEFYVRAFDTFIKRNALVVGVTRMDTSPRPGLYSYHTRLKELGVQAPVFEVDARNRGDVSIMLQALLAMLDPGAQR